MMPCDYVNKHCVVAYEDPKYCMAVQTEANNFADEATDVSSIFMLRSLKIVLYLTAGAKIKCISHSHCQTEM